MNNRLSPGLLALLLVVACAFLRLLGNLHPALLPNFTPCIALSFVGAAYLPHRWSWLLGVAAILLSEFAFLHWNYQSEGHSISTMLLIALAFYALMGGLGTLLSRQSSLALLYGGPILGSILFYLLANTYSWWSSAVTPLYAYPQTFAGWVQANTTGWPGYAPSWTFLRNGIAGDLVFTTLLIALFDPARFSPGAKVQPATAGRPLS